MNHDKARLLLQETEDILREYNHQLEKGEMIDITPFERSTKNFCATLQDMPREDAQIYEASLAALCNSLNALEEILCARKDETEQQITTLNNSANANKAYTNN